MAASTESALLAPEVTRSIRAEILDIVRSANLDRGLEDIILVGLSGPTRVLPEGKANLCSTLTFLSHSSAARRESMRVVPAVAAMEMLVAAYDTIDDIEDDEIRLPDDRRSFGQVLRTVSCLLMLCHLAVGRLADRSVTPIVVRRAFRIVDSLGIDALRGQTLDMNLETRSDASIEESLAASRLKSASLVRCAAELGACVGTEEPEEIELHARFGWHFGLMLQLMNDVTAVWPRGPAKSDLRLHKKTLPVAFALNLSRHASCYAQIVRRYYEGREESISEDEVKWALWRCGAIHYTWIAAANEKAKAATISRILKERDRRGHALGRLLV